MRKLIYILCCFALFSSLPLHAGELHDAILDSEVEKVTQLIKRGANVNEPDEDGIVPLTHAINTVGQEAVVRLLIEHGADVNAKHPLGQTPIVAAVVSDDRTILELLFKHGIDIQTADQYGDTPLHKASAYGELSAVSFLLENGADVNVKNSRGETPLMRARNEKTRRMFAK